MKKGKKIFISAIIIGLLSTLLAGVAAAEDHPPWFGVSSIQVDNNN
jgi:hypothetical protein